ncbi:MAG: hypothetical protein MJY72_02125 [Bacteroidales bacterium]|nr:hypothetical protein [Bacteroidales bacterium]
MRYATKAVLAILLYFVLESCSIQTKPIIYMRALTDDQQTEDFLVHLSKYEPRQFQAYRNAKNLCKICHHSDGALAEMVGIYCYKAIINNYESFRKLYRYHYYWINSFLEHVSMEIALSQTSIDTFEAEVIDANPQIHHDDLQPIFREIRCLYKKYE